MRCLISMMLSCFAIFSSLVAEGSLYQIAVYYRPPNDAGEIIRCDVKVKPEMAKRIEGAVIFDRDARHYSLPADIFDELAAVASANPPKPLYQVAKITIRKPSSVLWGRTEYDLGKLQLYRRFVPLSVELKALYDEARRPRRDLEVGAFDEREKEQQVKLARSLFAAFSDKELVWVGEKAIDNQGDHVDVVDVPVEELEKRENLVRTYLNKQVWKDATRILIEVSGRDGLSLQKWPNDGGDDEAGIRRLNAILDQLLVLMGQYEIGRDRRETDNVYSCLILLGFIAQGYEDLAAKRIDGFFRKSFPMGLHVTFPLEWWSSGTSVQFSIREDRFLRLVATTPYRVRVRDQDGGEELIGTITSHREVLVDLETGLLSMTTVKFVKQ